MSTADLRGLARGVYRAPTESGDVIVEGISQHGRRVFEVIVPATVTVDDVAESLWDLLDLLDPETVETRKASRDHLRILR